LFYITHVMANSTDRPAKAEKVRQPPPALNPESAALTQPWKDFVARGWITSLKVEFGPLGTRVHCNVAANIRKPSEPADAVLALGEAKNRIVEAKLWSPKGPGKAKAETSAAALPKKSLVKSDFEGSETDLVARANAVAKAMGDTTARGRIGSLKMFIDGCDTMEKWWDASAPAEKARLFMDKKHHDTISEEMFLSFDKNVSKCPFLGPVPDPSQEKEEERDRPRTPINSPTKGKELALVKGKQKK
jgi:hypothetical protein